MKPPEEKNTEVRNTSRATVCAAYQPLLHRYVEGELDPIRVGALEEHLRECPRCQEVRQELEEERLWLVESLVVAPQLSARLPKKVRRRIERQLQSKQQWGKRFFLKSAAVAAAAILCGVFLGKEFQQPSPNVVEVVDVAPSPRVSAPRVSAPRVSAPRVSAPRVSGEASVPPTPVDFRSWRSRARPRRSTRHAFDDDTSTADLLPIVLPTSEKRHVHWHRRTRHTGIPEQHRQSPSTFQGIVVRPPPDAKLRRVRVYQFRARVTGGRRLNMADLVTLAARLTPQTEKPAREDPCASDPNRDGITDLKDLAYACQVVMGGQTSPEERHLGRGSPGEQVSPVRPQTDEELEASFTESDCEEYCLRA